MCSNTGVSMGSSDDAVAADALGVASSGVGFHAHPSPPCAEEDSAGEGCSGRAQVSRTLLSRTHLSAECWHVACSFDKCTDDRLIRGDPFDSFLGVLV